MNSKAEEGSRVDFHSPSPSPRRAWGPRPTTSLPGFRGSGCSPALRPCLAVPPPRALPQEGRVDTDEEPGGPGPRGRPFPLSGSIHGTEHPCCLREPLRHHRRTQALPMSSLCHPPLLVIPSCVPHQAFPGLWPESAEPTRLALSR